jgi:glycosyltransferase involved in cell wall biosynthesis
MRSVSPTRVALACFPSSMAMGQQNYEQAIASALRDPTLGLQVEEATFGSRNSGADVRLPDKVTKGLPYALLRPLARWAGRRRHLVHRMDLRIPPLGTFDIVTVHDLPPLRFDDEGELPRWSVASGRRADAIVTPTRFGADEVRNLLGNDAVHVIPYGMRPVFLDPQPASDRELEAAGIRPPFFLHAAGATKRKGLDVLAGAWPAVASHPDAPQLVLLGPPDPRRTERFSGLENVVLGGHQTLEAVAGLMARSTGVVVPSTYEGFGLPALEGLACGVPVVAVDASALPEVCGGCATLVPPVADAFADAMRAVLDGDPEMRRRANAGPAHAANFTWERAARAHADLYRQLLGGPEGKP